MFEFGRQGGTRAELAPPTTGAEPAELAVALSQPDPPEEVAALEQAVEDAGSVTGRVERALDLFTAVAQGRTDPNTVLKEVDVLLGVLERLDREGRHSDVLRLARALASLLALLLRWVALVQTLKLALKAARALADRAGEGWAQHELGTLSLGAEDAAAANGRLEDALRLRTKAGDDAGVEATKQNLAVLRQAFPDFRLGRHGDRSWSTPLVAAAALAGALVLAAGGVAVAMILRNGEDPVVVDTVAPVVSFDEAPDSRTQDRSASFAFSADEEVRIFECRLDSGAFEECVSPENVRGPLDLGPHVFAVRAIDFAGNRGPSATHRWRVVRGEGPRATIVDAPAPLTNDPIAEFTIEAPGAVRLQCRFDDEDFEDCPTLVSRRVDEGDHTFTVRGLDGDGTAGPPARHLWTVDTTPPTVEIESAVRTGASTAEVHFTPGESEARVGCVLVQRPNGEAVEIARVLDCLSPASFQDLKSDLAYVVRVSATDAAGNVGEADESDIEAWSTLE